MTYTATALLALALKGLAPVPPLDPDQSQRQLLGRVSALAHDIVRVVQVPGREAGYSAEQ
jgi:hypothetical protein